MGTEEKLWTAELFVVESDEGIQWHVSYLHLDPDLRQRCFTGFDQNSLAQRLLRNGADTLWHGTNDSHELLTGPNETDCGTIQNDREAFTLELVTPVTCPVLIIFAAHASTPASPRRSE